MNNCIFEYISYCLEISNQNRASTAVANKPEIIAKFNFRQRQNSGIFGLLCQRTEPIKRCSNVNKKLRYREEHSASVVLSWCTL